MGFTQHATDIISKKIGLLTKCGATDIAKEFEASESWVSAFGLCVIFQDHPPEQNRAMALQFVRRVEIAFAEYSFATKCLLDLVTGNRGRWSPYFQALYHFEAAIAQTYLAYDCSRPNKKQFFEKDDGSDLDRLNKVYNDSKHRTAEAEQTLWITNDGVCSKNASISFVALEELLRSYARCANRITNQNARPDGDSSPVTSSHHL